MVVGSERERMEALRNKADIYIVNRENLQEDFSQDRRLTVLLESKTIEPEALPQALSLDSQMLRLFADDPCIEEYHEAAFIKFIPVQSVLSGAYNPR